jgi:hypothetical protein
MLALLSLSLAAPAATGPALLPDGCDVFASRRDPCSEIDGALHSEAQSCLVWSEITTAVGYSGYPSPRSQRFTSAMISKDLYPPTPDTAVDFTARTAKFARTAFDKACPMYAFGSQNPTCCYHPAETDADLHESIRDLDMLSFFEADYNAWADAAQFRLFPKCHTLLKFLPCAMCHPNVSSLLFNTAPETTAGNQSNPLWRRAVRLCSDYALEIYRECRFAIYEKDELDWVVPDGFGQRDFLRVVGHEYWTTGKEPHEGLNTALDIPGVTCIDLREWEELDAAPGARWPSAILAVVMALVSLSIMV